MPLTCAVRSVGLSIVLCVLALVVSNDAQGGWTHGSIGGWERTFGGDRDDVGVSVQQTSDGGFILLGFTESFGAGESDIWLIKTDGEGTIQWQHTFGGSDRDEGYSVQQTSDGGFILLGTTNSFGAGGGDIWLIKTDGEGNMLWQRTFGGDKEDVGFSVQQTSDGGFILLGWTSSFGAGESDFWLIKVDGEGTMLWQRTFGSDKSDYGFSVQQTSDGGFILLGFTLHVESLFAPGDALLIKTDAEGAIQWQHTFGGDKYDGGYSVQQTSDGGFILVGSTWSFGAGKYDVWLIKTDGEGTIQWQRTFGGSEVDDGSSVRQTSDGGFILLGVTESFGAGGSDFWLIKTDGEGRW